MKPCKTWCKAVLMYSMSNGYVLAELTHQNKVTKIFYQMLLNIGTEKFLSSSQGAQGMDRQNGLSLLPLYLWPFQVFFFSTYPSIGLLRGCFLFVSSAFSQAQREKIPSSVQHWRILLSESLQICTNEDSQHTVEISSSFFSFKRTKICFHIDLNSCWQCRSNK